MADRWRPRLAWAVFCAPALVLASPAYGQETIPANPTGAEPPSASAQGVAVYDAGFFGQYNPVNAGDMVARVPGFVIDDGADRRGFGATAGNVLINGERPSSKTIISDQLKRIPADAVARIELISGGAGNVDVRGQAQLVNVVLKRTQAANSRPGTWVLAARTIQFSDRIGYTVQGSKSFALWDGAELALDVQLPNLRGRNEAVESFRNAAGVLTESRTTYGQPNYIGVQGAAALKWRVSPQDRVNFNAQYAPTWDSVGNGRLRYSPNGNLIQVLGGRSEFDGKFNAEVGADWEHTFSDELAFKIIGLASFAGYDQTQQYNISNTTRLLNTQTIESTLESGERVARGFFTWNATPAHTLEAGVEGAFNFRDTTLDIFNQAPGGPRTPQPLAVSDARVEEIRGEAFVTDVWTLNEKLTLESGFTFEASRITQTGDESKEREFTYPKPNVSLTWRPEAGSQVRASIQRDISQLDFSEFASSLNVIDSSSIIGNPNLEPEKAWKYRIEWDRRFGKLGAFNIALFHDEVEDVHDLVVIGQNDAYGNIGDGTRQGIELRASAPLDRLGIPRSEIRFTGLLQETKVIDPLTGEERSFSISSERNGGGPGFNGGPKDWAYYVTFRQDLPKLKSAWGANVSEWSGRYEYRRAEVYFSERPVPRLDLYYETTAIEGITLRFTANNLFSPNDYRTRTVYFDSPTDPAAPRTAGIIDHVEYRKTKGGPEGTISFGIQASGKF